jgi:hypothetical protein
MAVLNAVISNESFYLKKVLANFFSLGATVG